MPIPFCHLDGILDELAKRGIERGTAKQIFAGFTLKPDEMLAEGRVIWKPHQENRAYRRALFEFPHPSGKHLTWSKSMAKESLVTLILGAAFQKLPTEWLTAETRQGLAELSNRVGEWFEDVLTEKLKQLGIEGGAYKRQIGVGRHAVVVPKDIGQIDFLGFSRREHLMVLCEAKMVEEGLEPKFFRDTISQFVKGKDNYADKFRKKIDWVRQNRQAIALALNLGSISFGLASVMVTFYPSYATYFIQDFPCPSLVELLLAYERLGKWPYTTERLP